MLQGLNDFLNISILWDEHLKKLMEVCLYYFLWWLPFWSTPMRRNHMQTSYSTYRMNEAAFAAKLHWTALFSLVFFSRFPHIGVHILRFQPEFLPSLRNRKKPQSVLQTPLLLWVGCWKKRSRERDRRRQTRGEKRERGTEGKKGKIERERDCKENQPLMIRINYIVINQDLDKSFWWLFNHWYSGVAVPTNRWHHIRRICGSKTAGLGGAPADRTADRQLGREDVRVPQG